MAQCPPTPDLTFPGPTSSELKVVPHFCDGQKLVRSS